MKGCAGTSVKLGHAWLSSLFIFLNRFFKMQLGIRALSWSEIPLVARQCTFSWQGALLAEIPACPPIGASFKNSFHWGAETGSQASIPWCGKKKGITLCLLRSTGQCLLLSPTSDLNVSSLSYATWYEARPFHWLSLGKGDLHTDYCPDSPLHALIFHFFLVFSSHLSSCVLLLSVFELQSNPLLLP